MASKSARFQVKSSFLNDYRRFNLREPTFVELTSALSKTYENLKPGFIVKYADDEGDLCVISSDVELVEAFDVSRSGTLKIFVEASLSDVKTPAPAEVSAPYVAAVDSAAATSPAPAPAPASASVPSQEPLSEVDQQESEEKEEVEEKPVDCARLKALVLEFLQDSKIQAILPKAMETCITMMQTAERVSVVEMAKTLVSTYEEIRAHPATASLLKVLTDLAGKIDCALNALLDRYRHFLPMASALVASHLPIMIQQLPMFLSRLQSGACMFRGPCHAGEAKSEVAVEGAHQGIQCDGCSMHPIVGVRFKCTVCPDYDLCEACEAKNIHPAEHSLLKLKQPARRDVHYNVKCDGCGVQPIQGVRYKCTVCPDYDLCEACETKGEHPAEHALLKLKVRAGPGHQIRGHGHGHHGFGGPGCRRMMGPFFHMLRGMGGAGAQGPCRRFEGSCPRRADQSLRAEFVRDVNYPDGTVVAPDASIIKQWEFLNPAGGSEWPEGTKLIYFKGNQEMIGDAVEFPITRAAPGEKTIVSVPMRIPKSGRCKVKFRIADAKGNIFGDKCWAELVTSQDSKGKKGERPEKAASPAPSPAPTPVAAPVATPVAAPAPAPAAPAKVEPPKADAPAKPVEAKEVPKADAPVGPYAKHLAELEMMGFKNRDLNKYLLEKCGGDLQRVTAWLCDMNAYKP